ncbi:MAG: hypothetical protein HZA10_01175 [Nitrospirae bacterium]|nr:hypothetical protein [Nitrospirota bacterium]
MALYHNSRFFLANLIIPPCLMTLTSLLFIANTALAGFITFEKEYTYQASELDSRVSCRVIAMEQVKRLLLEELGTYLESETEVKNFQLTKDQITILTAGIVRAEVIDEKWDGKAYRLKAKISADPDKVAKSVDIIRNNHQSIKELEDLRKRADEMSNEIVRLRGEINNLMKPDKNESMVNTEQKMEQNILLSFIIERH